MKMTGDLGRHLCRRARLSAQNNDVFSTRYLPVSGRYGHNISDMQILFNKTIEECRQLGARGGRACGRNEHLRKAQTPPPAPSIPPPPAETARQASCCWTRNFPG
jgi:hypothetical protein